MAKLVDVYRSDRPLSRRQLPLVVDENLTMVMDLNSMGLICDNKPIKGKELEEFTRKVDLLTPTELSSALQVTKNDMVRVLNQAVPCVGCRRSVERLYYQLFKCGHPTLDPLTVNQDGVITLRTDKPITPAVLGTLFHGHSSRLNKLVDSQPRRSKKSHRCLLHSLDSQRSRPITPAWRDVWECMKPQCKEEVVLIESTTLHITLESYLRKHRFCGECRTKVLRAYTLLVEEPEPCKEKGYVSALYAGIKRCLPDKHLHLQTKTDYISKLISRAEPELMGRYDIRRERHAKTLEIAQEEVLTCLGICVYERLHRIYVRMREEECTCQVFAAVAVDTLCRSFETAVEMKQGISQLELLYEELTKEELLKQQRKEQKKLKRRRKKERLAADEKENCNRCETPVEEEQQTQNNGSNSGSSKLCSCAITIVVPNVTSLEKTRETNVNCKNCMGNNKTLLMNGDGGGGGGGGSVGKSNGKGSTTKYMVNGSGEESGKDNWYDTETSNCKCNASGSTTVTTSTNTIATSASTKKNKKSSAKSEFAFSPHDGGDGGSTFECEHDDSDLSDPMMPNNKATSVKQAVMKETWSSSEHSHDCGYSSENNNGCCETTSGTSSLPSSPEGSEMACSGSCCNLAADCHAEYKHSKFFPRGNSIKLSLQQMLEDSCSSDEDGEGSYISAEEVREFQSKVRHLTEVRQELRQTLRKRFAQLCVNGAQMQSHVSRDFK
ncbi:uncharacterized protein CBL_00406 [Carabus blaptoides fortunei]